MECDVGALSKSIWRDICTHHDKAGRPGRLEAFTILGRRPLGDHHHRDSVGSSHEPVQRLTPASFSPSSVPGPSRQRIPCAGIVDVASAFGGEK